MINMIEQIGRYFQENLGISVKPVPWEDAGKLPPFLKEMYSFYKMRLLDIDIILMADLDHEEKTPAIIEKHARMVREVWDRDVVFLRMRVTAYNRKRLIEHKIPFVVPYNQMYLPMLGIDLREQYRRLLKKTVVFSPATQVLILHILLHGSVEDVFTPAAVAVRLGYSPMTMTRAFDEIESAGLAQITRKGRQRTLLFGGSAREVWEKAKGFLRDPVKRRVFITAETENAFRYHAGLTALAAYSDLAPPRNPVFAAGWQEWKKMKKNNRINELAYPEPESIEVEIWIYSPQLLSGKKTVDPLSVYLTLKDDPDERIEAALDRMMKGIEW